MGLDITAYSRLKHVGKHTEDWCDGMYDENYERHHVEAYAYDCFPLSFRGIPILGKESSNSSSSTFIVGGCYEITPETETIHFQAGSYSGYNHWRADLRRQFVVPDPNPKAEPPSPDVPFYELIWFADNEGSIGPEAAADLLADFREYADRYQAPSTDLNGYYREKYAAWTRACELAADSGLIDFH